MPLYILSVAPASAPRHTEVHVVGTVEAVSQKRALADSARRTPPEHAAQVVLYSHASPVWKRRADAADDAPRLRRQAAQTDAARVRRAYETAASVDATKLPSLSDDARLKFAAALLMLGHALEIADREAHVIIAANPAT